MKLSSSPLLSTFLLLSPFTKPAAALSSSDSEDALSPCVAHSPLTGLYYDLSAISLHPPELKDGERLHKGDRNESWHARGHDYPSNFTLNICDPVIEDVKDVVGVEESRWANVSAYYELDGRIYSIGYVDAIGREESALR